MSLPSSYLITTRNLESFLNSLITAQAPEVFTQKVLESLEFKSTNDRLFIGLLKGLNFLDENGKPTERYYNFLDQTQSKRILAEAVKEAYGDLFAVKINANELTVQEVKNKFRTLAQGKNSDKVLLLMANTFKALVDYSEWVDVPKKPVENIGVVKVPNKKAVTMPKEENDDEGDEDINDSTSLDSDLLNKKSKMQLHYNIQIHLPESRDQAVFDALFKSLKKHLF